MRTSSCSCRESACFLALEVTVMSRVSRNPRKISFIMEMATKATEEPTPGNLTKLCLSRNEALYSYFFLFKTSMILLSIVNLYNHRMVWVGRDLKDHLVPTPLPGQGHPPLDQGAQSHIQPGLGHFQGGGIHSFSGISVPVPHHHHRK